MQSNEIHPESKADLDETIPPREKLLERWVKQPPAVPNVQYLRDAERNAALERLPGHGSVLDLASESTLAKNIRADSVTRIDFSERAVDAARAELGSTVDRYEVSDPERPTLPFEDDSFDAAVSIGPFDWKFLDVVFSVPTLRSPYASGSRHQLRYFTPAEALDVVSPRWRLADYELLFQYPSLLHSLINSLPPDVQEPFVDLARRLSEELTRRDAWDAASYLVIEVEPLKYERYLDDALSALFRPVERNGFWNESEEKIVRALRYELDDDSLSWTPEHRVEWRYAPFALMGVMQWRVSPFAHDGFDRKLRSQLAHFADAVSDVPTRDEMPSYGLGPLVASFALAADAFDDPAYGETASELYEYTANRFDFSHAEDSLLLYGWTKLHDYDAESGLRADISEGLWRLSDRLTSEGLFEFENPTARRHQNQMYALWGLCDAIRVTGNDGYLDTAEVVLDYTIKHRMRADGAFIWEDVSFPGSFLSKLPNFRDRRPPHSEFLYECHQTFFVNAVASYYAAGGSRNYDRDVGKAMSWIFGENALGVDLVAYSDLGVPMRFVTLDGRMDVSDQMYKGTYEIGSYVMALTSLLGDQFE